MKNFKPILAKTIRVLTTPPVFAAVLCTLLYLYVPGSFASREHWLVCLGCLFGLPILAYPLVWLIPPLRRRGRSAERNLGLVFSVCGYIIAVLVATLAGGTPLEKVLTWTYLLSGVLLAVCTLARFKASAHTCGCSGPIVMLSLFVSPWFLCGYPLLTPIIWASRKLGRHTPGQLAAGAVIPVATLLVCCNKFLF